MFLLASGGTVIAYLLFLGGFGIDPFVPLMNQFLSYDDLMTNNIWFYLELFVSRQTILILSKIFLMALLSAIAIVILAVAYRSSVRLAEQEPGNYKLMLSFLVLVWSCLMAFSLKSNSWYFAAAIPFAYWWAVDIAGRKINYLITIYGAFACLNMSMHALLFDAEPITQLMQRGTSMAWMFLAIDFAMLVIEIVLAFEAASLILRDSQVASIFRSVHPTPLLRK